LVYLWILILLIQHQKVGDMVESFVEAMESCYDEGRPCFLGKGKLAFHTMSSDEFDAMSTREVQILLAKKSIVIYDMLFPKLEYNEKGLRTLGVLDAPIEIHDQSKVAAEDANDCIIMGNLRQLLESSCHPQGKILNSLDHPSTTYTPYRFSTDHAALDCSKHRRQNFTKHFAALPDLRWGLGAIKGATHTWHWDLNGFGTVIDV
jgi:hypothetical protein